MKRKGNRTYKSQWFLVQWLKNGSFSSTIMDDFTRHVSSLSSLWFVPMHLCGLILSFDNAMHFVAWRMLFRYMVLLILYLFLVACWSICKCNFDLQFIFVCWWRVGGRWFRVRCLHQSCVLENLATFACWKNINCHCLNRMGSSCLWILHVFCRFRVR